MSFFSCRRNPDHRVVELVGALLRGDMHERRFCLRGHVPHVGRDNSRREQDQALHALAALRGRLEEVADEGNVLEQRHSAVAVFMPLRRL